MAEKLSAQLRISALRLHTQAPAQAVYVCVYGEGFFAPCV